MEKVLTATERADKGVQSLAALMNYWLATTSHDKLAAILRWGYGEPTGLDGGSLSRIRNAKQNRGAGIKHLDAMAEANRAIWMWKQDPEAAIRAFGPHSSFDVKAKWLDEICWLPAPDPNEDQPMDLGDLSMLLMSRLELPYLGGQLLSPAKLSQMTERFAQLLEAEASERSWGPREATQQFQAAYPSTDPGRRRRLKELLMGGDISGTELELELAAFAEMLRSIRGLDSYTPADLQEELLSARRHS